MMNSTTEKCLVCGGQVAINMPHSEHCMHPIISNANTYPDWQTFNNLQAKIAELKAENKNLRDAIELGGRIPRDSDIVLTYMNRIKADAIRDMARKLILIPSDGGAETHIPCDDIIEYADNLEQDDE